METRRHPPRLGRSRRVGFTLVELLVVITIIGILASLIAVAAAGALKRARQAEIKVELDQISMAFDDYKNNRYGSYPPNCQTDLTASDPVLNASQVLTDLQRHMKGVAQRSKEPDDLLRVLVGLDAIGPDAANYRTLPGGMTAGEAIVFWLGGFSDDPRYPISGEGGPSYQIPSLGDSDNRTLDTLQRNWLMPLERVRLGPRDSTNNFFDQTTGRFIEYVVTVNGVAQTRRINFWQYVPKKSAQPYLYFDTSRHPAAVLANGGNVIGPFDPPAATEPTGLGPQGLGLHVHAVKKVSESAAANVPVQFVNPDKFQILHAGVDDEWGVEAFERMSAHGVGGSTNAADYLPYPVGPFTGEIADTIVNFSPATLEKSQP